MEFTKRMEYLSILYTRGHGKQKKLDLEAPPATAAPNPPRSPSPVANAPLETPCWAAKTLPSVTGSTGSYTGTSSAPDLDPLGSVTFGLPRSGSTIRFVTDQDSGWIPARFRIPATDPDPSYFLTQILEQFYTVTWSLTYVIYIVSVWSPVGLVWRDENIYISNRVYYTNYAS